MFKNPQRMIKVLLLLTESKLKMNKKSERIMLTLIILTIQLLILGVLYFLSDNAI